MRSLMSSLAVMEAEARLVVLLNRELTVWVEDTASPTRVTCRHNRGSRDSLTNQNTVLNTINQ